MKLLCNGVIKFSCGVILVGGLLFLSAGTWNYPNGWLLMGLLFLPMLAAGFVMLFKAPALLEKRLDVKEKQQTQKGVIGLSGLMFVAGFVVAGLDRRFGWSHVPGAVVTAAAVLFLVSYALYAEVLRENAYLSRTVKVEQGQKVVDTGLYGIVRHPMYAVTLVLFLSMPLVLGSWYAFLIFLCYPALIVLRLKDEEALLEKELPGYLDYQKKVRWRLIPFIW